MRILRIAALLLLTGGCGPTISSRADRALRDEYLEWLAGARLLDPPPAEYTAWWGELEAGCECEPALMFGRALFYVRSGTYVQLPGKISRARGVWAGGPYIVIAERWQFDEHVVKHEMLHAMLNLERDRHPPVFHRLGLLQ